MRIATSAIHQLASADIQRAQLELYQAQKEAGSEKKADDLKGFEREAKAIVYARGFMAKADAYATAGEELENRLATQDIALGQIRDAAQNVRLALTDALGLDKGDELSSNVEIAFSSAFSAMNMTYAGRYVFGGVRDDAAPVTANSLNDLTALGTADEAFANSPLKATAQLDSRTTLAVAPLADEVAEPLFASFKRIADFEAANGPFGAPLTAAQKTFIEGEITALADTVKHLTSQQSYNGGVQAHVADIAQRQRDEETYFEGFVGDLESVDLAEVASRLSQAQLQLEASAQIYSTLRNATLLDVL